MAWTHETISVGTSATKIAPTAGTNEGANTAVLTTDASEVVYLGGPGVTTATGVALAVATVYEFDLSDGAPLPGSRPTTTSRSAGSGPDVSRVDRRSSDDLRQRQSQQVERIAKLASENDIADHVGEADPHTQYVLEASTDASAYGFFLDEDDMASDDATKFPSQQSVKAYVDTHLEPFLLKLEVGLIEVRLLTGFHCKSA